MMPVLHLKKTPTSLADALPEYLVVMGRSYTAVKLVLSECLGAVTNNVSRNFSLPSLCIYFLHRSLLYIHHCLNKFRRQSDTHLTRRSGRKYQTDLVSSRRSTQQTHLCMYTPNYYHCQKLLRLDLYNHWHHKYLCFTRYRAASIMRSVLYKSNVLDICLFAIDQFTNCHIYIL